MNPSAFLRLYLRRHHRVRQLAIPIDWLRRRLRSNAGSRLSDALSELPSNVLRGELVVAVPGFPGEFSIDIRSHVLQRVLLGESYEPRVAALVKEHVQATRDCIDVGANIGLFTSLLASLVDGEHRVLAIEPTPGALEHLRTNLKRSEHREAVHVFEGVASDIDGEATIYAIPGKEEYSSVGGIVHPSIRAGEERVAIRTSAARIDSLVVRFALKPGLIKIDTEGAEYLVLKGAIETLRTYKPVIICELSDSLLASLGHKAVEIVDLLEELGYSVYNIEEMKPVTDFPFNGEILALPSR